MWKPHHYEPIKRPETTKEDRVDTIRRFRQSKAFRGFERTVSSTYGVEPICDETAEQHRARIKAKKESKR